MGTSMLANTVYMAGTCALALVLQARRTLCFTAPIEGQRHQFHRAEHRCGVALARSTLQTG